MSLIGGASIIGSVVPPARPIAVDADKINTGLEIDITGGIRESKITDLERVTVKWEDDWPFIDVVRPNPLDAYDLSTYHLKLFMADPMLINSRLDTLPTPRVVLVESGITDIAFKDLSYEIILPYNQETYTTTFTQINFTLFEPLGCTFLDRIAEQAQRYGIQNFNRCPFWIEISFRARDPKTGEPIKNLESGLSGKPLRRIVPIIIVSNQVVVSGSGTEYHIKAVRYHDSALADENALTKEPLNVSGSTAREIFARMSEEITKRSEILRQNQGEFKNEEALPDEFVFELSDEFIGDEDDIVSSSPMLEQTGDTAPLDSNCSTTEITVPIPAGYDLTRSMDMIMQATRYMREGASPNNNGDENRNQSEYAPRDLYTIQTKVEILGYDTGCGDYAKRFTYTVFKNTVSSVFSNPEEANKERENVGGNKPNSKVGVLLKKYDYLFLSNKDILSFDCTLNTAWFVQLPRQSGQANANAHAVGPARSSMNNTKTKIEQAKLMNKPKIETSLFSRPPGAPDEVYAGRPTDTLPPFPSTFKPAPVEFANTGLMDTPNDLKDPFVSAIFKSTVAGTDPNLLSVNLEIRGDPDWLDINTTKRPYFEFNMGLPRDANMDGLVQSSPGNMITGYYYAITVKNNFENGKFTQTIKALRDINVVKQLYGEST